MFYPIVWLGNALSAKQKSVSSVNGRSVEDAAPCYVKTVHSWQGSQTGVPPAENTTPKTIPRLNVLIILGHTINGDR